MIQEYLNIERYLDLQEIYNCCFRFFATTATIILTVALIGLWKMVRRTFASKRPSRSDGTESIETNKEDFDKADKKKISAIARKLKRFSVVEADNFDKNMDRGFLLAKTMSIAMDDALNGAGFIDDLNETSTSDRQPPDWIKEPRDVYHLPEIILSTYSQYNDEADYAMKQMLAVLESLNPSEYVEMFESALKAIEDRLPVVPRNEDGSAKWPEVFDRSISNSSESDNSDFSYSNQFHHRLSSVQMGSVFDALPFLIETVTSNEKLSKYLDILYMMVVVTLNDESNIRRQCISAISILLERQILSQEFLKTCIVPGLFHVYETARNPQSFPSGDLKQETCQTLCQLISCDSIRDRKWIFENFIPRYSRVLEDTTMHVRKNALHIFGKLGNLFGEKFSDAFLVPHLLVSSSDLNWAVRKTSCECFVEVAKCCSSETRKNTLAPIFAQLLSDPNKWVSLVAYNHLGQFISLFADPNITGFEMINGKIFVRGIDEENNEEDEEEGDSNRTIPLNVEENDKIGEEFGKLPETTYIPNEDLSISNFNIIRSPMKLETPKREIAKTTPKRGERVMDSVLSGLNKMLFDRTPSSPSTSSTSSPKSTKESVPTSFQGNNSKKSPLSFHSASFLMDKWNRRNNPNNTQRFQIFDESSSGNSPQKETENDEPIETGGFAARCSSTDDLSKLGLDDACSKSIQSSSSSSSPIFRKCQSPLKHRSPSSCSSTSRKLSPRGRPVTTTCWNRLDVRNRLFLRRLGALPPSPKRLLSPPTSKTTTNSPLLQTPSPTSNSNSSVFEFEAPKDVENKYLLELLNEEEDENDEHGIKMEVKPKSPKEEVISNEFTLSYWSADCNINFSEEELKPFGASITTSQISNSYLERRLDVTKELSPKRVQNIETKKEDLGILDFSDNMSISSNESDCSELEDVAEKNTYKHVPHELVHIYYQIIRQSENMMTMEKSVFEEVYRHCAHNFPAICYTLGKNAWPTLRLMLIDMAKSPQTRVRASVAYSIHEIAHMFGTEITDTDLIEIFNVLRDDSDFDVRAGIMSNLFSFVKYVSPQKRESMIRSLPQFFPVGDEPGNHSENGDWRTRFDLISQLIELCSLYDIRIINLHLSGIALTLADDRVAAVRREAVGLVSKIVSVFVSAEWKDIQTKRNVEHETIENVKMKGTPPYLSEQFVEDISSSFARTQKWTRRQTFCFICEQVLNDRQLNTQQFAYFFSGQLKNLVKDKVPNVRISACEVFNKWRQSILFEEENTKNKNDLLIISNVLTELTKDQDVDTAFIATKYQKPSDKAVEVDVKFRTQKMREREEKFFGDVIYSEASGKTIRVSKNGGIEVIRPPIVPIAEPEAEDDFSVLSENSSVLDQTIIGEEQEGPDEEDFEIHFIEPPMISAEIVQKSDELCDNTECVDMEIEEEGEVGTSEKEKNQSDKSTETSDGNISEIDESEIPMDPAPSNLQNVIINVPIDTKNGDSSDA